MYSKKRTERNLQFVHRAQELRKNDHKGVLLENTEDDIEVLDQAVVFLRPF